MNHTLTTTLSEKNFIFLGDESKRKNLTKKAIIERGLEYYRKIELEKQVREGFQTRNSEYSEITQEFSELQFNSLQD